MAVLSLRGLASSIVSPSGAGVLFSVLECKEESLCGAFYL